MGGALPHVSSTYVFLPDMIRITTPHTFPQLAHTLLPASQPLHFLRQTHCLLHRDAQFKEMIAETCCYVVGRQSRPSLLICREHLFPLDYLELRCRNTAMKKSGARPSQIRQRCFISPNHTISCEFQGKPK